MLTGEDSGQLPLGAPEAVNLNAVYVVGQGWHLHLSVRRQFQQWGQASRGSYDYLTTEEFLSVVESALSCELGL